MGIPWELVGIILKVWTAIGFPVKICAFELSLYDLCCLKLENVAKMK